MLAAIMPDAPRILNFMRRPKKNTHGAIITSGVMKKAPTLLQRGGKPRV
jgi:hypothetical protein